MSFSGAKLALFLGRDLLVIKRDDKPDIPYPGYWDLPGGGREGGESPEDCALRETFEEVSLLIPKADLIWSKSYQRPRGVVWFFVSHQPAGSGGAGEAGVGRSVLAVEDPRDYCAHDRAVPHFAEQLRHYLDHVQG
ncbi:NUDIX domain-containing protein [Pseudophaeobacter leonis]|uniref:NUDIX domain-containing protein n=1 Tax=Pseudophaeobacter leonis TaxID=1144477 RepID=UPI00111C3492|nr:NUDIX hydrolase [Pseudophaeobacter leonis]